MAIADIGTLIVSSPDIRGGRARIAGTGVTVSRVVSWYKLGQSPEEIADEIGHLTLAQVYAALAYYHCNQSEIDADVEADDCEGARLEKQSTNEIPETQSRVSSAFTLTKTL
jgi:uncharacterized protein (DUF433 family)